MFNFAYMQLSNVVPTIISAGRYFAREITLGNMMQINSAFGQVQFSIAYFVFSYSTIANWRAVMDRLLGFKKTIGNVNSLPELNVISINGEQFKINLSNVNLPNGKELLKKFSLTLTKGEKLLIQGYSGSVKTTLLKAINGLWPYVEGEIYQNQNMSSLFISQKPYLPRTNLKEAICYPKATHLPSDEEILQLLKVCNLEHLNDKLYELCDWSSQLSLGEQQKV